MAWEKVVSLIGYFDLDPNRTLDVILDLFFVHCWSHHAFFLELLRCTGWTRAKVVESDGGEEMEMDEKEKEKGKGRYVGMALDDILRVAELGTDGMEPDLGPTPVCAQVLGFKFAHYQVSRFCLEHVSPPEKSLIVNDSLPNRQNLRRRTCTWRPRYSSETASSRSQTCTLTCALLLWLECALPQTRLHPSSSNSYHLSKRTCPRSTPNGKSR